MPYESSTQTFVPTTGQTITIQNNQALTIHVLVEAATTLATLTCVMPNKPYDGQRVSMCSIRAVTAFTLQGGVAGATFNVTASAISAQAFIEWVYFATSNRWIRFGN